MSESRHEEWPQRSWAMAIAGALVGLALDALTRNHGSSDALRTAVAAALFTGGVSFAFTLGRDRITQSAAFAALAAVLVGGTVYLNGGPDGWSDGEGWRLVCAILTVVIAAPLFQGWCDAGQPRPPRLSALAYPQVYDRAWMNVLLWFACWAFAAIVFLLGHLLAELFALIGINLLRDMMGKSWFTLMLGGGAFGAASGLFRDREAILVTLQTVVRRVLSVLGPALGFGLVVFLLALLFTGLDALWDATRSTTPIVLSCVIVAVILANAAIGDSPEDEAKIGIIRWGTIALGVAMFPLAVIAAISTGLRVNQYGLTPDRLWAIVFDGVALTFGAAYLATLVRKRMDWWASIRPVNLWLVAGLSVLVFVLATPVVNFGAWSAASQARQLESGAVSVKKFDWAAMRFDFGSPGVHALKRLAKSGKTAEIRAAAAKALKLENRYEAQAEQRAVVEAEGLSSRLVVKPVPVALPERLLNRLARNNACERNGTCVVIYTAEASEVTVVGKPCATCIITVQQLTRDPKTQEWYGEYDRPEKLTPTGVPTDTPDHKGQVAALKAGKVEIRPVTRRQVYVDGKPVGVPFE